MAAIPQGCARGFPLLTAPEGEHQILSQSLTLCPTSAHAGQCCPMAKEACCPQVLPQGPQSLPCLCIVNMEASRKECLSPLACLPIPQNTEDVCVMAELHFHRLFFWPHAIMDLTILSHVTMPVLQSWPEDSNEAGDGLSPGSPLELLSGRDPKQKCLLETSRTVLCDVKVHPAASQTWL